MKSHLLSAKERDVGLLVREGEESLELDGEQAAGMETFLSKAWFSGTHACHAQMLARIREQAAALARIAVPPLDADFKVLMDESADTLNLTVTETVSMWELLGRACIAGIHTCRAEITALLLETRSDVGEEALRWLEERGS